MIRVKKYDLDFVKNNIDEIKRQTILNARKLFEEARLLGSHGHGSRALFLLIAALEELAKFSILDQDFLDENQLSRATSHNLKVDEIVKILSGAFGLNLDKKDTSWTKDNRIVEMREDVLYVRLKPHPTGKNYPLYPKEDYWGKRSWRLFSLISEVLKNYE